LIFTLSATPASPHYLSPLQGLQCLDLSVDMYDASKHQVDEQATRNSNEAIPLHYEPLRPRTESMTEAVAQRPEDVRGRGRCASDVGADVRERAKMGSDTQVGLALGELIV
jgi:hypothetical protein